MNLKHRRYLRALGAAGLTGALALGSLPVAGASGLEAMRDEAQAVADAVTGLERSLAALGAERVRLAASLERAGRRLAVLESVRHDAQAAFDLASERYARRAVEAYKDGANERLALLLSATSLGEMLTLAEATALGAERDARALRRWQRARRSISSAEEAIEERKARLLEERARVEEVSSEIEQTLEGRRAALEELVDRIDDLEAAARREAERRAGEARRAEAAQPSEEAVGAPSGAGPEKVSPGELPESGFIGTGVTFEGIASWYGPGFEGQATASGDIFHADGLTAASLDLPLGTWLRVTKGDRSVIVLVNDRGPYIEERVLDLSRGAAEILGFTGLAWVSAEIVLPPE
ncbi:MAG: septal ring lytic transglycosylase RlpA family protein [Actinomycetota bacterium]|nr:septal ring lytic transglycosylase RlpA family protein [Actinomycetota bacterium]